VNASKNINDRLPNFLFLGPDKSGSTWLFDVLSRHPSVYLSPAKDVYFFDQEYHRGIAWYAKFFRPSDEQIVGEICHNYLGSPVAPDRIRDSLGPSVKLMACLREPLERAYSDYLNLKRNGWQLGDFETALLERPNLIGSGLYYKPIRNYLERFGRDQMHVGVFDELRADPQAFLNRVTDWMRIERMALSASDSAPSRPAAAPRSQLVARMAKATAIQVRKSGHPEFVGRAKSNHLIRKLLTRDLPPERPSISARARRIVREAVRDDVHRLSAYLDHDFAGMWGY
jgi:hypothetical protein